jgi:hypothetical protein
VTKSVITSVLSLDDAQVSKINLKTCKMKMGLLSNFCFAVCLTNFSAFFAEADWPASPNALYAQDNKFPLKEYANPNRMEGIAPKEQLVAGERLLIISATIENSESLPDGRISSYNLKFYINDSAKVSIEVWEYDKFYKMAPFLKSYPAGLSKYSWPPEIPLYYKIALKDLLPLAKTMEAVPPTYLPIALYYTDAERRGQFYSFGFTPLKGITTLEYTFCRLPSNDPIHSGRMKDIRRGQKIFIQWNGKDSSNKMADSGLCKLVIAATYTPRPGTHARPPITTEYRFYHQADLMEK